MFITATALGNGDDVIELDLIVLQMFVAVLTSVVVAANDPHLHTEWNVSSCSSPFDRFGEAFSREDDWANVAEDSALHFGDCWCPGNPVG